MNGMRLALPVFLLAMAGLAWEVALTRLFALTQFYHFAFLAVNVALLGFGAGGTLLSLKPGWTEPTVSSATTARRLEMLGMGFAGTLLLGYGVVNGLPFDSYAIAWDRRQIVLLAVYYLALALPFFGVGLAIGLALAVSPTGSHRLYGANLLGSALGALAAAWLFPHLGLAGLVFALAGLGVLAALGVSLLGNRTPVGRWRPWLYAATLGLLLLAAWRPPAIAQPRLSPYKTLSQLLLVPETRPVLGRDGMATRIDVLAGPSIRSLPGLSLRYEGPLPPQYALLSNGDDLSPVLDTRHAVDWAFLAYLPEAPAYALAPPGPALVLGPRGGLAIWQALGGLTSHPARSVVAVEAEAEAVAAVDALLAEASPYRHPAVTPVVRTIRSFLAADRNRYAVIHLALARPFRPVTSGAFSLVEDYTLTTEAVVAYLEHLAPGGILVLTRWLQMPPSEDLRALGLLVAGLRQHGIADPGRYIVALRGLQTVTFWVKMTPWRADELAQVRTWANARRFDLALAPDLQPDEINRFQVVPDALYERTYAELLAAADFRRYLADQPFAVTPPTDDHPFFFHFFKWAQTPLILRTLGQTWQPFGGSGMLVLVALLLLAVLASALFILLPLAVSLRRQEASPAGNAAARPRRGVVFLYFAALGLGFLLVEIPLIQRFILFLGHPTLAAAITLAGVLFWSGLGSLLALRLPWSAALAALIGVVALYAFGLQPVLTALLAVGLGGRLLLAWLLLAPLGLLLGMPFPRGWRWLQTTAPHLAPWAWAINGSASVVSAVLAALLALEWGFTAVLLTGMACYGVALGLVRAYGRGD